jgi:hypothetical protein
MHAEHALDHLALMTGGRTDALPDWAKWLVWLGQWLRMQVPCGGRRIAVVRIPSRRTAAAFASLGVLLESARLHEDSLDWAALKSLASGTKVFWRESSGGRSLRCSGGVVGVQAIDGQEFMVVSMDSRKMSRPVTRSFARRTALTHGITLGAVTTKADERLAGAARLVKAAIGEVSNGWVRSLRTDCVVVSERTSFFGDLANAWLCAGSGVSEPFVDVLSVSGPAGHTHGKTRIVSARQPGLIDAACHVTILDGAPAVLRMSNTAAASVLAILDPSEYDQEVEQVLMTCMGYASDAFVHLPLDGLKAPPPSAEIVVFGLPLTGQPDT